MSERNYDNELDGIIANRRLGRRAGWAALVLFGTSFVGLGAGAAADNEALVVAGLASLTGAGAAFSIADRAVHDRDELTQRLIDPLEEL